MDLLPPAMRRSRAYYGVQLAEIHLAQSEHEQAAHTVAALDATSLDSRRITGRIAAVQHTLTTQEPPVTAGMAIRHYDHRHAAELRPLLLEVYAEAAKTDPFATVDRFAQG
ncbi:hypothetical protein [Streptomyces sp. Ac-502]|uniref:hypothetical protein n=1 Tax=Streptomyces sp. Ac-502 TaxID=3342801 RepID=UPI0038627207